MKMGSRSAAGALLAAALLLCTIPISSGADAGTPASAPPPTEDGAVSTVEDLRALDGQEGRFYLTRDIDLGGAAWTPIEFCGSLDGQGHAIRGLVISGLTEDLLRYGLFSTVWCRSSNDYDRIYIRDLTLEGMEILLDLPEGGGDYEIGGLCGDAYKVTFEDCRVSGTVRVSSAGAGAKIAGLCGEGAPAGYVRFFDCVNECTVLGDGVETVCGLCAGTPEVLTNCVNRGAVTAELGQNAAGLAYGAGTVFDSVNAADVSVSFQRDYSFTYSTGAPRLYAGGLVAYGGTFFTACRNTGDVTAYADLSAHTCSIRAGGLAAVLSGDGAGMRQCGNTGAVTARSVTKDMMTNGDTIAGGLTAYAQIDSFHNSGFSQTYTDCRNSGEVVAHAVSRRPAAYAGGICGYAFVNGGHTIAFEDCLSAGHVIGTCMGSYSQVLSWDGDLLHMTGEHAAGGGIVGQCTSSLVEDDEDVTVQNCAAVCPDVESVLDLGADGGSTASWIAPYGRRTGNVAVSREDPDAKYEDDETLTVLSEAELRTAAPYAGMGWDLDALWIVPPEGGYPDLSMERDPGRAGLSPVPDSLDGENMVYASVTLTDPTGREVRGLLFLAAYDEDGRFLAFSDSSDWIWVDLPFDPREAKTFTPRIYMGSEDGWAEIRAFFLDGSLVPLAAPAVFP